jgi:hypothetical protein
MQCSNCRFQNMPGTEVCGRCGTSLRLATAVIDVHPPRARPLAKRLRRHLPVRNRLYQMRDVLADTGATAVGRSAASVVPPLLVLACNVIPGWAHRHTGRRGRGLVFLLLFLAFLLPGLALWGSTWGSVLLGLAFSVHSSAALDAVNLMFVQPGVRPQMVRSLAVTVVLAAAVYWPAGRLLTGVADPRAMVQGTTAFRAGDVVLVNHWAAAAPGRVVLYEMPDHQSNGRRAGDQGMVRVRYFGERVERILAGPGDHVRVEGGVVLVNGRRLPRPPLALGRYPTRLIETVPPGHYFILPTTTNILPHPDEVETWQVLSNVPVASVRGVAYARSQPLSRFELVR